MTDAGSTSARGDGGPLETALPQVLHRAWGMGLEGADVAVLKFLDLAATGGSQVHLVTKRFLRVNRHFSEMVGYTPEELEQMTFLDLTPPEDRAENLKTFERLVRGELPSFSIEKRLRRKNGVLLWATVTVALVRDETGRPLRTIALVQDITEKKSHELNRVFLGALQGDVARVADAEELMEAIGGKLRRWLNVRRVSFVEMAAGGESVLLSEEPPRSSDTKRAEEVWRHLEFPHWNFWDDFNAGRVIAVEDVTKHSETAPIADALRAAGATALLLAPHASEQQCKFVLSAQHDRPRRWTTAEIELMRELANRVWLWLDRSWAEQALRESETRLRRATQIDTVGILFFNLAEEISDANDAFLRMSGYSRDELRLGLLRRDRMTPVEWLAQAAQAAAEFAAHGRTAPYEKEYLRKDGSRWWGLVSAARLSENEGVEFVVDITQRKCAEEQLRRYQTQLEERVLERTAELDSANGALRDEILERERAEAARQALMGQLVAAQEEERRRISRELHDVVGQHLTALMLGLKSLGDRSQSTEAATLLRDLQQLTETVGKEIHDLALELRPTALDDLGLVRALSNYIGNWSARANIEVDFHSTGWEGARLPSHIETTIYRVVCEALTNVLKHASAQHVSVILERRLNQAVAIVEDDGRGFDSERMQKTASARLGLTSMRERAGLVGGELNVESDPGHGTTVFLRVPLPANFERNRHV